MKINEDVKVGLIVFTAAVLAVAVIPWVFVESAKYLDWVMTFYHPEKVLP